MKDQENLFIKMALDAWKIQIERTSSLINSLSDEQLRQEVAPGRNSGVYLLGHLTAVHDALFTLLGIGDRMYAHFDEIFVNNPDKSGLPKPGAQELRSSWIAVNQKLSQHFESFSLKDWFTKHTAISDEDFKKEPHRNRLNVLLNRTGHLANHLGQLIFLKP
jgi:hypothetical protein